MNQIETKLFEQQAKESAKAFEAFTTYMNLGPTRSLAAVGQKLGKSKVLMERWSKRHNWVGRVDAYVQYMVAMKQKLKEEFLHELALAETERDQAQSESE